MTGIVAWICHIASFSRATAVDAIKTLVIIMMHVVGAGVLCRRAYSEGASIPNSGST
jgi:hypothetical protein